MQQQQQLGRNWKKKSLTCFWDKTARTLSGFCVWWTRRENYSVLPQLNASTTSRHTGTQRGSDPSQTPLLFPIQQAAAAAAAAQVWYCHPSTPELITTFFFCLAAHTHTHTHRAASLSLAAKWKATQSQNGVWVIVSCPADSQRPALRSNIFHYVGLLVSHFGGRPFHLNLLQMIFILKPKKKKLTRLQEAELGSVGGVSTCNSTVYDLHDLPPFFETVGIIIKLTLNRVEKLNSTRRCNSTGRDVDWEPSSTRPLWFIDFLSGRIFHVAGSD